ncbi:MAG: M14 family metallopeptidase [Myxococcota bacterium]
MTFVIAELALVASALYAGAVLRAGVAARALPARGLARSAYRAPDAADAELDALAERHPTLARVEAYGRSQGGRALRLVRVGAREAPARLLVTGHIHAGEFVGGHVARAVARAIAEGDDDDARALRARAQVLVAPLLNPDGAVRVWERGGWTRLSGMRHTQGGVDPNRNFPFEGWREGGRRDGPAHRRERAWNSARSRPGTVYYRGPGPLSEVECRALVALCARERFCAALHFHSFGAVVYAPALVDGFAGARGDGIARGLAVFEGAFQSRQRERRYRYVPERPAAIAGQLDAYLVGAFGIPSATVEVGRPGLALLHPARFANPFWLWNPVDPERWARNDVPAALHALRAMLDATGGAPSSPRQPRLAAAIEADLGA